MRLSWPSVYLPGAPSLLAGAAGAKEDSPASSSPSRPEQAAMAAASTGTPVPAKRTLTLLQTATPPPGPPATPLRPPAAPTPARRARSVRPCMDAVEDAWAAPKPKQTLAQKQVQAQAQDQPQPQGETQGQPHDQPQSQAEEPSYVTEARQWLMETDIDAQWRRLWRPAPLETDLDAVLAGPGAAAPPPRSSTLPPPSRRPLQVFLETDLDAAATPTGSGPGLLGEATSPKQQAFGLAARTCSSKETDIDLAPSPSPRQFRTLPRTRFLRETDVDEAMGFVRRTATEPDCLDRGLDRGLLGLAQQQQQGVQSSFDTVCSDYAPTPPRRGGYPAADSDATTALLRSSTERTFTETDLDDDPTPARPPAPPLRAPMGMMPPRPDRPTGSELVLRPPPPPHPHRHSRPTDLLMPPPGPLGLGPMGSSTMSGLGSGVGSGGSALGSALGSSAHGGVFTVDGGTSMLDSDVDESELRRLLLNDVSYSGFFFC